MKYLIPIASALLLIVIAPMVSAASDEVRDHPGYVDFDEISSVAGAEPLLEVSLNVSILRMLSRVIQYEDQETGDLLSRLIRVSVIVFASDEIDSDKLLHTISETAYELDRKGWDRVMRMREKEDKIDIYFKLSDDGELIHGITIMAIHETESSVFVNFVGDFSPEDISRLGERYEIDELRDLDYGAAQR